MRPVEVVDVAVQLGVFGLELLDVARQSAFGDLALLLRKQEKKRKRKNEDDDDGGGGGGGRIILGKILCVG